MAISLKKKVIALLVAFMAVFSISLLGAPSANATYTEATNAGNSDRYIIVSDGTNVYSVAVGQTIGGNLIGWFTEALRCTSVYDRETKLTTNVNASHDSNGAWANMVQGHHYYMYTWNCN